MSPRRTLRVDPARRHEYVSVPLPASPPDHPYALYMAGSDRRFRLVVFDLDEQAGDPAADVWRLRELLDAAGVTYIAATSGPGEGRHVWTAWPAGVDARAVRTLARRIQRLCPSLDVRPLSNPLTGCVRPPGSPHRHGGAARLLPEWSVDAAAQILTAGNPPERWAQLVAVLPSTLRPIANVGEVSTETTDRPGATRIVTDGQGRPRLAGERREPGETARQLLSAPLHVDDDASAVAWRILLSLAIARYAEADVQRLAADPAAAGLEHLRSCRDRPGAVTRTDRGEQARRDLTARQWEQAVHAAAGLPHTPADGALQETAALVARVQARADADPSRWATAAGPCDRQTLDAVCLVALDAAGPEIALDVRRAAEIGGIGAGTAARALGRLAADPTGPWLRLVEPGEGRAASVWRLLDPAEQARSVEGVQNPTDVTPAVVGGTQGEPAPAAGGGQDEPAAVQSTTVAEMIKARLGATAADLWWPRHPGLGHHTARTWHAMTTGITTVPQLQEATGYTAATVRAHLRRLELAGLIRTVQNARALRVVLTGRTLRAAAAALDVGDVLAVRARRHVADREIHAWWCEELEWRSTRGKQLHRRRRGHQPTPAQRAMPIEAGPKATYGRFPTHPDGPKRGRADFAAARTVVAEHLQPAAAATKDTTEAA